MKRRTFLKTASGLFVPSILCHASVPSHRRMAARPPISSGAEPTSPLGDPNIGGFWRSDTALYEGSSGDTGRVRCDLQSAPRGWHDQSANAANWGVNTACGGPFLVNNDINGKPSVSFDGTTNLLGNAKPPSIFTPQPVSFFYLIYLVSSSANTYIFDSFLGGSSNWGALFYTTNASPEIRMSSGSSGPTTSDLPLNTWGIVCCIFDQASSSIQINNGTVHTGNVGTRDYYTLCLGSNAAGSAKGKFRVAAGIWSKSHVNATWLTNHKNWLAWYGGLAI